MRRPEQLLLVTIPAPDAEARRVEAVGLGHVSHSYGQTPALDSIDLTLQVGSCLLLGRNGAGKSTLSQILAGFLNPVQGHVLRDGKPVTSDQEWRHHHGQTGWLPQTLSAPMSLSVEQYLRYAAWLKSVPKSSVDAKLGEALVRTDLVEHRKKRLRQLSGGTLRRVGIAQAIVHSPALVVLDEPTVGLDPEQRSYFHEIIRGLSVDRLLFISTHLLEDVEALADRVLILDRGGIRFDGDVESLRDRGSDVAASTQERLRSGFLSVVRAGD